MFYWPGKIQALFWTNMGRVFFLILMESFEFQFRVMLAVAHCKLPLLHWDIYLVSLVLQLSFFTMSDVVFLSEVFNLHLMKWSYVSSPLVYLYIGYFFDLHMLNYTSISGMKQSCSWLVILFFFTVFLNSFCKYFIENFLHICS